jgi:hypothetical protein
MADEKKNDQVNVDFSKFPELLAALDSMVEDDFTDRSKFVRKLIREEKARREEAHLPLPSPDQPKRRKNDTRAAQAVAA